MDHPQPQWMPDRVWRWLSTPWRAAVVAVVVFAVLGAVLMAVSDRKDSAYWAGYIDAQNWVDDGGYAAADESIGNYCHSQAAGRNGSRNYERGCVDGGRNAMKSPVIGGR